jgi:hypothetical protein
MYETWKRLSKILGSITITAGFELGDTPNRKQLVRKDNKISIHSNLKEMVTKIISLQLSTALASHSLGKKSVDFQDQWLKYVCLITEIF